VSGELKRHWQLLAQWKKTTEEDNYPVQAGPGKKGQRAKRNQAKE